MMNAIELARKLAGYGQKEEAQKAYFLALQEAEGKKPKEELEAASFLFFSEGNVEVALTTFVSLYNRGLFQDELLDLMVKRVYLPNMDKQRKLYEENCKRLECYPYLFRQDFLKFNELPILFFPFNDRGFIPFYQDENRFGDFIDFDTPVIDRYFFKDLENPILAEDVYSQYQLEYLNDTVRKSEWVAKENHIYLHYTNWQVFCSYLQCLSFKKLVKDEKIVFLIEEEKSLYPIDFKERFGIDYSQYSVKPVGIREYNRLIWHSQLSTHNGGDFFNEIFFEHPNLLVLESIMFENIVENVEKIKHAIRQGIKKGRGGPILNKLYKLPNLTDKDCFIALFLSNKKMIAKPDPNSRIVPVIFFQPHFPNIYYSSQVIDTKRDWTTLVSEEYNNIRTSPIFQGFRYIKTFTPMRRITTSYAASLRFAMEHKNKDEDESEKKSVMPDCINTRMLNRSYLIDWQDRLYQDSILVRFEDGKLNPKATFTALAEFLDIPYTESMTYCSTFRGVNTLSMTGNVRGFDPASVYKTYDEYANDDERAYLEFFFRDAYEAYGYDFQYYKGEPVDEEWIRKKIAGFTCANSHIRRIWHRALKNCSSIKLPDSIEGLDEEMVNEVVEQSLDKRIDEKIDQVLKLFDEQRFEYARYLLKGLNFINERGQPLRMMKALKLDPALLEQPLYH